MQASLDELKKEMRKLARGNKTQWVVLKQQQAYVYLKK